MMNKRVAVLVDDQFEDSEVKEPIQALRDEGFEVVVVGPEQGTYYKGKKGEHRVKSDLALDDAKENDFDCLLLPGGQAPESLRGHQKAVALVAQFMQQGKPVAAICHGPQLLISARCLEGRKATSVSSIAIDVKNAGAQFEDSEVVVDNNLVTSRTPDDMPAFVREMLSVFHGRVHAKPNSK